MVVNDAHWTVKTIFYCSIPIAGILTTKLNSLGFDPPDWISTTTWRWPVRSCPIWPSATFSTWWPMRGTQTAIGPTPFRISSRVSYSFSCTSLIFLLVAHVKRLAQNALTTYCRLILTFIQRLPTVQLHFHSTSFSFKSIFYLTLF